MMHELIAFLHNKNDITTIPSHRISCHHRHHHHIILLLLLIIITTITITITIVVTIIFSSS